MDPQDVSQWAPAVAGAFGVAASLVGSVLYLLDVRQGTTRPHLWSWLIWSVIAVVAAASQGAQGGGWSLLVLCGQATTTVAVALVALRFAAGCGVGRVNAAALLLAIVGVVGWRTFDDPLAATCCAAAADAAGLLAVVPKAWSAPDSETAALYGLSGVSGLLAVVAVFQVDAELLVFPVYFCLGNSAVAGLIAGRRRVLAGRAGRRRIPAQGSSPVDADVLRLAALDS